MSFPLSLALKGMMLFKKREMLNPRYIVTYEIFRTIGEVAYELALLLDFLAIHPFFHVSILRHYIFDESHMFHWD